MARRRAEKHVRLRAKRWTGSPTPSHLWLIFVEGEYAPVRMARTPSDISIADAEAVGLDARNAIELEVSMDEFRKLTEGRHFYTRRFLEDVVPAAANPIEGMPGGSVSGCIKAIKSKHKGKPPRDVGAYCAAIADRIEPGWRRRGNPTVVHDTLEVRWYVLDPGECEKFVEQIGLRRIANPRERRLATRLARGTR